MRCPEVVESLIELLKGALAPAQRVEIESHLAGCSACRAEWEDTRLGAALFDSHVPSEAIVALAWDRSPAGLDPHLARRHLEGCLDCREDLALTRESVAREAASRVLPPVPSARARIPGWTAAAGLAAAAAVAFAAGLGRGSRRAEQELARAEVARRAAVESAVRSSEESTRLRGVETDLRARLERLATPRVNLPLIELLPGSSRMRDRSSPEPELALGPEDALAALVLSAPTNGGLRAAELSDEKGRVLWRGSGLRASPLGGYVIGVPTEILPEGRLSIVLFPETGAEPRARFSFRVRRSK